MKDILHASTIKTHRINLKQARPPSPVCLHLYMPLLTPVGVVEIMASPLFFIAKTCSQHVNIFLVFHLKIVSLHVLAHNYIII